MRILLVPILLAAIAQACTDSSSGPETGGAPVKVLRLSGDDQTGMFGQPTPVAPTVLVIDADNRPVAGVPVTFFILKGGGAMSSGSQTTGANGAASVTWTLGNGFGVKELRATAGALGSVIFTARAIAPDAGMLAFNQTDPANDTLPPYDLTSPKAIDLLFTRGDFKRDSLILTLTFASPVAPNSAYAVSSVSGFIEIDIDDNPSTGEQPQSNYFGTSANLGIDYGVSLFSSTPTSISLYSTDTYGETTVPASFAGNVLTIRIPMKALGSDDGNFGLVGVVGTSDRPTDFMPNTGAISVRLEAGPNKGDAKASKSAAPRAAPARQLKWGSWPDRQSR